MPAQHVPGPGQDGAVALWMSASTGCELVDALNTVIPFQRSGRLRAIPAQRPHDR